MTPDDAQEERAGRGHDGDIWQDPIAVVSWERVDDTQEEGMARDRAHGVVGDASGYGPPQPGRVGQEGVEATVTAIVQVNVDATIMGQDEISDGVGALDVFLVVVKGFKEPGVFSSNKLARLCVGPQFVLPIRMKGHAAGLGFPPYLGDGLVLVGLVYDFGYHLGSAINEIGARRRQFGT